MALADIDDNASEVEMEEVIQRIQQRFDGDDEQRRTVLNESFDWYVNARSDHTISRQINEHQELLDRFSQTEKQWIVADLECIARADGAINEAEENLIKAVNHLLAGDE